MNEDYTKEIEDAAKKYTFSGLSEDEIEEDLYYGQGGAGNHNGFIEGVNSKIATKIKLEFAIEKLNIVLSNTKNVHTIIDELKQQLKDLK